MRTSSMFSVILVILLHWQSDQKAIRLKLEPFPLNSTNFASCTQRFCCGFPKQFGGAILKNPMGHQKLLARGRIRLLMLRGIRNLFLHYLIAIKQESLNAVVQCAFSQLFQFITIFLLRRAYSTKYTFMEIITFFAGMRALAAFLKIWQDERNAPKAKLEYFLVKSEALKDPNTITRAKNFEISLKKNPVLAKLINNRFGRCEDTRFDRA
jgi:hypothetical protein